MLPETATFNLSPETGDFVSVSGDFVAISGDYSSGNKIAEFENRCGQAFKKSEALNGTPSQSCHQWRPRPPGYGASRGHETKVTSGVRVPQDMGRAGA